MKAIVSFITLLLPTFLLSQTPANDDCAGIFDLGLLPYCSAAGQFFNQNATASVIAPPADNVPSCWNGTAERDVWFQFATPPNGSIAAATITVEGNVGGNGTMRMPQVALYRGTCAFGDLDEVACAAAAINTNAVRLDAFNLLPGEVYFLRVNDYSATASPNSGTFKLCIQPYNADVNMGDVPQTGACAGTLYDSGGPSGDYDDNENLAFSICPAEAHQCIRLKIENFDVEQGADVLHFFAGNDVTAPEVATLTGHGSDFDLEIPAPCATIFFQSDFALTDAGFKISWQCTPDACATPAAATCNNPVVLALPYQASGLSNCVSANSVAGGPCNDAFLEGNDYVFKYTSPGDECLHIEVTGANEGAGIGLYSACPDAPGAACVSVAGGQLGQFDPTIKAAFLENPGDYYLVFGAGEFCSPFDIKIEAVTCPKVLPSAALCDESLNIGGCNTAQPEIIALSPGAGDPNFNQTGVNAGCWEEPNENYAFFYFTAAADGKFGFTVQAADPNESSDIDINVWGPIENAADRCVFVQTKQPVRSTWSDGDDPTGLIDVHPTTGIPVLDAFDCGDPNNPGADGDDFVSTLPVQKGKTYVVLLDDYGGAIASGGVAIDFSATTAGVLGAMPEISVTADATVCKGQSMQLAASGGEAYFWSPDVPALSCINCANPVATVSESIVYTVEALTACGAQTREVRLSVFDLDLGPDVTVCVGASFELNPHPQSGATYSWTGPNLSCYNCPTPTVSGLLPGNYTYIATLSAPGCTVSDTLNVRVNPGQQPQYAISPDKNICVGDAVSLGGAAIPGNFYAWVTNPSDPTTLFSTASNPNVTPSATTTYYLFVAYPLGGCAGPAADSVTISVFQKPTLNVAASTTICAGQSLSLGSTAPEAGVTYQWSPTLGLDDAASANPTATPPQSLTYSLIASNPGCASSASVNVTVTPIGLTLDVPDTTRICLGNSLTINAMPTPTDSAVHWSPSFGLTVTNNGKTVVAAPDETATYTAMVENMGCTATKKLLVRVDALPSNMEILPKNKTICQGDTVLFTSKIYEPADFPDITFEWLGLGQLTPDSFYNMLAQPEDTMFYFRIAQNGACVDTQQVLVNVVQPPTMEVVPQNPYICPGESVKLTVTYPAGVTDIEWSPDNGSLSCLECDSPTASPIGTEQYNVEGTFGKTATFGGCPTNAGVTVFVRFLPRFEFPADRQLCAGESAVLNSIAEPGTTYTWTSTDPTFGTVTDPQPQVTPAQTQTYYLLADNTCKVTDQVTLTVYSATLQAKGDTMICKNESALLSASSTGTTTGTYEWSNGAGSGPSVSVSPAQTTVYAVTYTYGDDCVLTDDVTVTIAGEAPVLFFPTDTQVCPGESVKLNNDPAPNPAATYVWVSDPAGFTSAQANPSVMPSATTTYKVTATLGICQNKGEITITRHSATLTASKDTTVCEGTNAVLTANGTGQNGQYQWSPGGSSQTVEIGPITANTVAHLLYTYGDGCTLTDSVIIKMARAIKVSIACDPEEQRLEIGTPLELTAEISPTQSLTGFSFEWFKNSGQTAVGTEQIFLPETGEYIEGDSAYVIWSVVAVSPAGCRDYAEKGFWIIRERLEFPNAFTPGGTGMEDKNNTFGPILLRGDVAVEKFEVFDRWGQKVFSCNDCTTAQARWDGNTPNGHAAPSDVYVYVFKYRRGDGALQPTISGEVTLLR